MGAEPSLAERPVWEEKSFHRHLGHLVHGLQSSEGASVLAMSCDCLYISVNYQTSYFIVNPLQRIFFPWLFRENERESEGSGEKH